MIFDATRLHSICQSFFSRVNLQCITWIKSSQAKQVKRWFSNEMMSYIIMLLALRMQMVCEELGDLAALEKPPGIGWGNNEQTKFAMEPNQKTKELRPIVVPVILLQIVMVSPRTHFVKNHESQGLEPWAPVKVKTTTTNPKLKMLGPLCNQTVNLKTDAKSLYYSVLKIKYSPSILKHNKG